MRKLLSGLILAGLLSGPVAAQTLFSSGSGLSAASGAFSCTSGGVCTLNPISSIATSLALGGATIGTNALAVTGTVNISGQITSTLATGTPPFAVSSTTNVANLNASSLGGATFAAPGAIGGGTPSTGAFAGLTVTGSLTATALVTNASLANMANGTIKCRTTAGTGVPEDCTGAQATVITNVSKVVASTRDMTAASGNVAYTGFGFQPRACDVQSAISGTEGSLGMLDSSGGMAAYSTLGTTPNISTSTARVVGLFDATVTNNQTAAWVSYDADGLTLAWTKTGSPTGTAAVQFRCFK